MLKKINFADRNTVFAQDGPQISDFSDQIQNDRTRSRGCDYQVKIRQMRVGIKELSRMPFWMSYST